jgi:hypothetical protein
MGWWFGLAPATLEFKVHSQTRGTRENRRTLCASTGFLYGSHVIGTAVINNNLCKTK